MTVVLDTAQRDAVDVSPGDRQIVLAGPGAGKSEVVGALAAHLVDDEGAFPEELLVISFSRAAVGVVEQRTAEVVDEGHGVEVRTIDSLAAEVIRELSEDEPTFRGYDKAIEQATALMRQADEPVFDHLRHVIVDEVQDVVGVRADFVLALLRHGVRDDTGFTLLGDPMQALYDFQLTKQHPKTCSDFLAEIKTSFDPAVVELLGDHRSRTVTARTISGLRGELQKLDAKPLFQRLQSALADLSPLGDLDADAAETVSVWRGRTAFLCDTNARAGLAAQQLADFGLLAETATSVTDAGLPPWIAVSLADHPKDTVGFDEFVELATTSGCETPPEVAWRSARALAPGGSSLNIPALASALDTPRGRNLFRRSPTSRIVVSTVHRAKGLEFDNVVLVDPNEWVWDDDLAGASALLYVALSRATTNVTTVEGASTQPWRPAEAGSRSVWTKAWKRRGGLFGVLIEPWMARGLGPTTAPLRDLVGQPVTWEHDEPILMDGEEIPSWRALVDDVAVATTGADFGKFMTGRVFGSVIPDLRGARIDGLETAVGAPRQDAPGHHGLWLAARISGPVDLDWK
ncbi:UvrD-helicase domain-containing protein [Flexivirga sp. B27]